LTNNIAGFTHIYPEIMALETKKKNKPTSEIEEYDLMHDEWMYGPFVKIFLGDYGM
jgi:hypothetical protein